MAEFNPYEWHEHHKQGKPRWRVRVGMAEKRLELINELQMISDSLEEPTFASLDRWYDVHSAVLACEEFEVAVS